MGRDASDRLRRRVIYRGHVQGVGFRYTTVSIARRYPVVGYVKNLPNGTVELVVEATSDCLHEFLDAVARTFAGYIADSVEKPEASNEGFERFEIRY